VGSTYGPMKHLTIVAIVLWFLFQLGRMFWSSNDQGLDEAFSKFLDVPQRSVANPYHNGYFYLLGLTAAAPFDPARIGYEIWVEESKEARRSEPDESRTNRSDLVYTLSPEPARPEWEADDPLNEFRKKDDSPLRAVTSKHQILLTRY